MERIIKRAGPLPGVIRQAEIVEEQEGDGYLGPSDFRTFIRMEVEPAELGKWTKALAPAPEQPDFTAPREPVAWWIAEDAFRTLEFYEPKQLFGRTNGWVGVSPDKKTIYVVTFTL